jgi:WD40 repeat protein
LSTSIPTNMLEKFTTFGDFLRFLRRRAGITQLELSIAVGYSNAQISRLEQNLRLPDLQTIEARFVPALGIENEPDVVARLLELATNIRREDAPGPGLCPYKGLSFFDELDADLFVGREALTARLVERVLSLSAKINGDQTRFLAIVGASGSGKSSLVRAGLVPAIRWNSVSANWPIYILTPTAQPLESLANCLTQDSGSIRATATLLDDMAQDPRSAYLFSKKRLLEPAHAAYMLLVVDQFEELFALCRSEEERTAFIDNLLTTACTRDGPGIVVITLRADFYAACSGYPQLREALAQSQEYIGAMSSDELRRAIEEPARRGRWEIEPGLVDLLLRDVSDEPGALPLLSHALMETWKRRRGRELTMSGYASSGGVRGAISETAEAVFSDQFDHQQQTIARRIFLRLTELGDETATGDTRRRASFTELILKPEEADATHSVLNALADARLITTSEESAEVAHEALIREWPTLRSWLEENRESLRLHRHISETAQEWQIANHEPGGLYRGARLAQAKEWAAAHAEDMNDLERTFLNASIAFVEEEAAEREAQRSRQLDAVKKVAEVEKKRVFYLGGAFTLVLAMVIVALFFGIQARQAATTAQQQERVAFSRELAAAAISSLEQDPERSILLSLFALRTEYTREGENALHQAVQTSRVRLTLPGLTGGARSVEYSPDGKMIITTSNAGDVTVWDSALGMKLFRLPGNIARISQDGSQLVTGSEDGTVAIWDFATRSRLHTLKGHTDRINEVNFSPDGKLVVSSSDDETFIVWNTETGQKEFSESVMIAYPDLWFPHNVSFSPDGSLLISIDITETESRMKFWDVEDHWTLRNQQWSSDLSIFSRDGKWLVMHGATNNDFVEIMLWDLTGKDVAALNFRSISPIVFASTHNSFITGFAFSPDGTMMASVSQDSRINVWRISNQGAELLMILSGHMKDLRDAAFSPDNTRLATTSWDGTVKVWDITPTGASEGFVIFGHNDDISRLEISKDGRYLATAGKDGAAIIWETNTGKKLLSIENHGSPVFDVAFNPNGTLLATAGYDNTAKIWSIDLTPGAMKADLLQTLGGHDSGPIIGSNFPGLTAVVFSPDGKKVATGGVDDMAKVWDLQTGKELFSVQAHPEGKGVCALAFSTDGKWLATASDGLGAVAKIWDVSSEKEVTTFTGHIQTDFIWGLAFDPESKQVATGSGIGSLKIWDPNTGEELWDLVGHNTIVSGVNYRPDGKYLASTGPDGTIRIWDPATGEQIQQYNSPKGPLFDVAFTQDGKNIIASGKGYIYSYIFDIEDLIELGYSRLTRWFTAEECQEYLHMSECPIRE